MSTDSFDQLAPDRVLSEDDPGDETARRYRFQWIWAAITCCNLFDDTQQIVEVFCEHHEDILLKYHDGTFTGQQVKTRESDQPLWKAGDEQIKASLAQFVRLNRDFPGYFRSFHLLTSHPFHTAKNAQCLNFNLTQIAITNTLDDLPPGVKKWLHSIANLALAADTDAFEALKKTRATDSLPKLQDSMMRLMEALTGCWTTAGECSHVALRRSAQALVDECARASALEHLELLPAYILPFQTDDSRVEAAIRGKRITVEHVRAVLQDGLTTVSVLAGTNQVEPGIGSTELLQKKLDAGGFSAVSRNSAEDLRDKADYLGIVWTKRFGKDRGLERYNHIRSVALSDASRSFEATKSGVPYFGPAMREDLRGRFKERRANGEQLFDCTDEHLEGIAYSLTSQCQIQWSLDRPWEVE
jgi:hypothetical protein